MTAHDSIVAALTMESLVYLQDSTIGRFPISEHVIFARVLDLATEFKYKHNISPGEFMRTIAILEAAGHIERSKSYNPYMGINAPFISATVAGRKDALGARPKLVEVLENAQP